MASTPDGGRLTLLAHPLIDTWVPDHIREGAGDELVRARLISLGCLALSGVAVVVALVDATKGQVLSAALDGSVVAASLALLPCLERSRRLDLVANLVLVVALAWLALGAALHGGLAAPQLLFVSGIPLVALRLTGRHAAVGWLIAAVIVVVAIGGATAPDNLLSGRALVLVTTTGLWFALFVLVDRLGRDAVAAARIRHEARTQRILDAAAETVLLVGTDGRIEVPNAAASELFGRHDLVGAAMAALLPGSERLMTARHPLTLQARTSIGPRPVEAMVTRLDEGQVWILRDVTQFEAARRALEDARDRADAASHAKAAFLASMSHELRTPLNAVVGYAEMMMEQLDEGVAIEEPADLQRIAGSASHLLALIDQVLDLTKVESGQMDVDRREFELDPFLEELDEAGQALARARGNRFSLVAEESGVVACTDPTHLRQVMLNLLSNAAKFTRSGDIELSCRGSGDGWLELAVRDTGVGMTETEQQRVWDEFVQADTSTTRRFGGTGLGLALSRRLVELLGGCIELRSTPGAGTTITVWVPAAAQVPVT